MVLVERANPTDRLDIERLIAAYLTSEGVKPRPERITWAVEQVMKNRVGGLILVGREKKTVVGVALAVYSPSAELGRLLIVNDFFVDPGWRRKGVGRALATRLLEEAKAMRVERIDLEVTPTNATAATFSRIRGPPCGAPGTPLVRIPCRTRGTGPAAACAPGPATSTPRGAGPSQMRSPPTPPRSRGSLSPRGRSPCAGRSRIPSGRGRGRASPAACGTASRCEGP